MNLPELAQIERDGDLQFCRQGKCPSVTPVASLLPPTTLRKWKALPAVVRAARQEIGV